MQAPSAAAVAVKPTPARAESDADLPAHRGAERLAGLAHFGPRVRLERGEAGGHGLDGELVGADAVLDFLPRQRRRDRRAGTRARRIGTDRRGAAPVAQIV